MPQPTSRREQLFDHLKRNHPTIKQGIIDDVRQFIGRQKVFDDITLLVVKQQ